MKGIGSWLGPLPSPQAAPTPESRFHSSVIHYRLTPTYSISGVQHPLLLYTPHSYPKPKFSLHTLPSIQPLKMATTRYKLIFHVPLPALSACKSAIFAAGAGAYPGQRQYTECCFVTIGTGQFRRGVSAKPNIGQMGVLEEVQEARVETLCVGEAVARGAAEALRK